MTAYIVRRTLIAILLIWVVATVIFFMMRFLPGDALMAMSGENPQAMTAEQRALVAERLGLDRPLYVQYGEWLARVVRGDFGVSLSSRRPVIQDVMMRIPRTVELAVASLIVGATIGIPLGVVCALKHKSWLDISINSVLVVLGSLPAFVLGIALILIFGVALGWVPTGGFVPFRENPWEHLRLLILPSLTLGLWIGSIAARMTRSAMLESLAQDYVRTAYAKGLNRRAAVFGHALGTALIPVVTAIGLQVGGLLGGAVLTEVVFTWPGLGSSLVSAVLRRDYPVVQAVLIITSAAFVFTNLFVDILVAYLDPRVTYE